MTKKEKILQFYNFLLISFNYLFKVMIKNVRNIFILFLISYSVSFAQQYPYLDKKTIIDTEISKILDGDDSVDKKLRLKIDSYFSLNLNENWRAKTSWKINPVEKRKEVTYPERYRSFFDNKDLYSNIDFFVEQLKAEHESDDLVVSFGKFNPRYGNLWNQRRYVGSSILDFIRDYEYREKIGYQISFLGDEISFYFSNFFNDDTDLSDSAWKERGKEEAFPTRRAGNNSTLSSYAISIEGTAIEIIDDFTYNIAYSNVANNSDALLLYKDEESFLLSAQKRIYSSLFIFNNPP